MPRIGSERRITLESGESFIESGFPQGSDIRKPIKKGCVIVVLVIVMLCGGLFTYGGVKSYTYRNDPANKTTIDAVYATDMAEIDYGIGKLIDFPSEYVKQDGWWISLIIGLPILTILGGFIVWSIGDGMDGIADWFRD